MTPYFAHMSRLGNCRRLSALLGSHLQQLRSCSSHRKNLKDGARSLKCDSARCNTARPLDDPETTPRRPRTGSPYRMVPQVTRWIGCYNGTISTRTIHELRNFGRSVGREPAVLNLDKGCPCFRFLSQHVVFVMMQCLREIHLRRSP